MLPRALSRCRCGGCADQGDYSLCVSSQFASRFELIHLLQLKPPLHMRTLDEHLNGTMSGATELFARRGEAVGWGADPSKRHA